MYVAVKELPPWIQRILLDHGYHRPDVSVQAKEAVSISNGGMKGQQAWAEILNLETRARRTFTGSWGGSNMFNPTNRVDMDTQAHTIPPNGMVITGSSGYRSFASIYVHPSNLAKYLGATETISDSERRVLKAYGHLKSGPYRKQALENVPDYKAVVVGLVERGLLKQSRNGATQITTSGKNALQ